MKIEKENRFISAVQTTSKMKTYILGNLEIEIQKELGADRIAHFSGVPHAACRVFNTENNAVYYAWVPSIFFLNLNTK